MARTRPFPPLLHGTAKIGPLVKDAITWRRASKRAAQQVENAKRKVQEAIADLEYCQQQLAETEKALAHARSVRNFILFGD